jgi:POT family proton-dependent oligopeptide transporter
MEQVQSLEEIQNFKGKYPKQLWALFFSEMWERFCFYGLRGMLTVFMVTELMMDSKQANLQYGATQAWVYAFTFIGGMMADKILGFKKSLFWGGLLMIAGSLILMIDPKLNFFFGIGFLIVGTGFFKPNISSMVGQLYKNDDTRRDAGFSLFYAGINLGAFLGGILMIGVAQGEILGDSIPLDKRWNYAFGLVAVAMIISLLVYFFTNKNLDVKYLYCVAKYPTTKSHLNLIKVCHKRLFSKLWNWHPLTLLLMETKFPTPTLKYSKTTMHLTSDLIN